MSCRYLLFFAGALCLLAVPSGRSFANVDPISAEVWTEVWMFSPYWDTSQDENGRQLGSFLPFPAKVQAKAGIEEVNDLGETSTMTGSSNALFLNAYSGTWTGRSLLSLRSPTYSNITFGAENEFAYQFELDREYELVVRWDNSGAAGSAVQDVWEIWVDGSLRQAPSSGRGRYAEVLGPGPHSLVLYSSHDGYTKDPYPDDIEGTGVGGFKWMLKGCEHQPPIAVSNNRQGGIIPGPCIKSGAGDEVIGEWVDEGNALFELYCRHWLPRYDLEYYPDQGNRNDLTLTGQCRWKDEGKNYANIAYGADDDGDSSYGCFISSYWQTRDAGGEDEGVEGKEDMCVYRFDVKSQGLTTEHYVRADPGSPFEILWPHSMTDCPCKMSSGSGLLQLDGTSYPDDVAICDVDADGDCDSDDNDLLMGFIGHCKGSPSYRLLYDADSDGCVGARDMQSVFPDLDFDGDGYLNVDDNCISVVNDQLDTDGDGWGDDCDCAVGDGSANAVPKQVRDVLLVGEITLIWTSETFYSGEGTAYDVLRGAIAELPVGTGGEEVCLESSTELAATHDKEQPDVGGGFYYLVRAVNACGVGTYGYQSDQTERQSTGCP